MSISTNDFARIRWSLAFLAVGSFAGFAMTYVSQQVVSRAEASQRQLAAQQRDIRIRLSRANEEEQDMRHRIARYQALLDRGIIGQEERLNWVEQIARIKADRRLLDLQYDLSPQKPVDDAILPGGALAGSYELMASTMHLQMPLLHEYDLLGFLSDLRQAVHAHLLVRDCAIERAAATGEHGLPAQLRAECTIDWITLRERK